MKRTSVFVCALGIVLAAAGPAAFGDGAPPLVVDDDMLDCPNADFTTIQAAVDDAEPGATIHVCAGAYHERVTIMKNGLRLLVKGAPGGAVVDADTGPAGTAAFLVQDASGVRIEGFTVREGHEAGILLVRATKARIRNNLTTAASHDGIQLSNSHNNVIEHNISFNNPASNACGINVIGAGSTGNLIRRNLTVNNMWGVQVAGSASGNTVFGNTSIGNRSDGVRHINASGNVIKSNRTFSNARNGIRLQSSTGVLVARNHAFDSGVFDLFTDNAAANTFENNRCNTSSPPGLCTQDGDDDDEGDGDH